MLLVLFLVKEETSYVNGPQFKKHHLDPLYSQGTIMLKSSLKFRLFQCLFPSLNPGYESLSMSSTLYSGTKSIKKYEKKVNETY